MLYCCGSWMCCLQIPLDCSVSNAIQITGACCAVHKICENKGEYFGQEWVQVRADLQALYWTTESMPLLTRQQGK